MSLISRLFQVTPRMIGVRAASSKSVPATPTPSSDKVTRVDAYEISGVPPIVKQRTIRIYSPAKTAMSSGHNNTGYWSLDFDVQGKWENPMMGWTSSADPLQALNMKFATKDDAIAFAEKQGWDYWIDEPKKSKFVRKVYADNFTYVPGKLRLYKTK